MKVEIKKVGINGEGIGYIDRTPVFIPKALIGEVVDINIVKRYARYAQGELNYIVQKSKDRIHPKCRLQEKCGGCALMHVRYPKQLVYKKEILTQSLIKYAQIHPKLIENIVASEDIFGYRNQCKMPCATVQDELRNGMYMPNSNIFIDVSQCFVHDVTLEHMRQNIIRILRKHHIQAYSHKTKKGLRSLVLRGFDGMFQCTLVTGNDQISDACINELASLKGMYSLWQSIHTAKKTPEVFGKEMHLLANQQYLPLQLGDIKLQISPRSFFQLNTKQAQKLYAKIAEVVGKDNDLIVEAYSGIGGISMYLKDCAKEIIGIESIKDAVVNANQNAKMNGCSHISFICADAADKLVYLSKKRKIDVLVVDPPRTGLDDIMLACILQSKIKKVVYVSCNPATLGKNLAILQKKYHVKQVTPFDMFPHTPAVESVVVLERK